MTPSRRTRSYRRGGVFPVGGVASAVISLAHRAPPSVAKLASDVLGALAPCPICGAASPGGVRVCHGCDDLLCRALARTAVHGDTLWLGPYAGPMLRMVHALKFGGQRALAPYLGERLAKQVLKAGWEADCVTFVPASTVKLKGRGFDQAELLARSASEHLGIECRALLTRSQPGAARGSQAALGRSARSLNAAGAFTASGARRLRVLLVDDVMTSGATLTACRTELLSAGARQVTAAVVARTVRSESDLLENDDHSDQDP